MLNNKTQSNDGTTHFSARNGRIRSGHFSARQEHPERERQQRFNARRPSRGELDACRTNSPKAAFPEKASRRRLGVYRSSLLELEHGYASAHEHGDPHQRRDEPGVDGRVSDAPAARENRSHRLCALG
jgi:hypothetical protein